MHTWAWLSWLAASLAVVSLTRNPLYLILALLCIVFVSLALQRQQEALLPAISAWKFFLFVVTLATVFNALTSHFGTTILITIPGHIPMLSGVVTLEALVYGATSGLVLAGLFASFSVLNQALPVRALIRLIPRVYFPAAVVTSIAVTYIPTTIRHVGQIREAQAVRGHQVRGWRDWLPLLMPLLVGGLEHALQLAEAMTARGFSSTGQRRAEHYRTSKKWWDSFLRARQRLALLSGLLLLTAGWLLRLAGDAAWAGILLMTCGAVSIGWGLWSLGRQAPRTIYQRETWQRRDSLVMMGALLVLVVYLLPLPGVERDVLWYSPYPSLTLPSFDPWLGIVTLGLLVPGLVVYFEGR